MKLLILALISAAFTIPAHADDALNTRIIKENSDKWVIKRVLVTTTEEGTRVSGRMNSARRSGLPSGHIDIAAYTPEDKLIIEKTTRYTPRILSRKTKQKGGVRFSVNIEEKLPNNALITLAFHEEESLRKVPPVHRASAPK